MSSVVKVAIRLLVSLGETFVRAYHLTSFRCEMAMLITYRVALQNGDSGSWVIESTSAVVYGHVVVTNDLGEADIKHRLLAGTLIYIPK